MADFLVLREWNGTLIPGNGVSRLAQGSIISDETVDVVQLSASGLRVIAVDAALEVLLRQGDRGPGDVVAAAVQKLYDTTPLMTARGGVLTFGGGNVQAAGPLRRFLTPWYGTAPAGTIEVFIERFPFDAELDQLRGRWGPTSGSQSVDFDLRVNSADTDLDFTVLSDAGLGSNLVDVASVLAGDQVSFGVVKSASTGSGLDNLQMSMRVREV